MKTFTRVICWFLCLSGVFHVGFLSTNQKRLQIPSDQKFNVQNIFSIFVGCHFKFFLLGGLGANNTWDISDQLENVAKPVFPRIPISVYSFTERTMKRMTTAAKNKNMSKITCIIHAYVYIEEEFIFGDAVHHLIYSVMSNNRFSRVWPHHSIFLSRLQANQTLVKHYRFAFFTYGLQRSSARGIIIFVDLKMSNVYLVCVTCISNMETAFTFTRIRVQSSFWDLNLQTKTLNSNMRKIIVFGVPSSDVQLSLCNFKEMPNVTNKISFIPKFTDCVHLILQEKLNYTYYWNMRAALSASSRLINRYNVNETSKSAAFQWSPYLSQFEQLHLTFYQQQGRILGDILTLPYHWKVWLLFSSCVIALIIFSSLWATAHKIELSMSDILLIVSTSSFLEQGLPKQDKLPNIWGLWIAMMLVFSGAYKGRVYELVIHGICPTWPSSLKQLVCDESYLTVSVSSTYLLTYDGKVLTTSLVRQEFLEPAMIGTPGVDYSMEIYQLNKSLIYHYKNISLITDIISQNVDLENKRFAYTYDGQNVFGKLATINRAEESAQIQKIFMLVYKELVSSDAQTLAGYQIVQAWMITNSFFFEYFEESLGLLDQAGFLKVFESYLVKLRSCNETVSAVKNLTTKYNIMVDLERAFRQCYVRAMYGMGNGDVESEPLKMENIFGIFFLYVCTLVGLIVPFCLEVVVMHAKTGE